MRDAESKPLTEAAITALQGLQTADLADAARRAEVAHTSFTPARTTVLVLLALGICSAWPWPCTSRG